MIGRADDDGRDSGDIFSYLPVELHMQAHGSMTYLTYAGLIVCGSLILFGGVFFAVIEITTAPAARGQNIGSALAAVAMTTTHVVMEVRKARRMRAWRWTLFAASLLVLMYEITGLAGMRRDTAIGLCVAISVGAVYLAIARLVLAPHVSAFVKWPWIVQAVCVVLAWPIVWLVVVGVASSLL